MNSLKRLLPIADILSVIRSALAILLVWYAYSNSWNPHWSVVFIGWVVAWLTDSLDGPLAQRFGSLRDRWPNLDNDGIADTLLALAGTMVVTGYAYGHWSDLAAIGILYIYLMSWLAAVIMVALVLSAPNSEFTSVFIAGNMLLGHAVIQIGFTSLWMAYMVAGIGGVIATLAALLIVAMAQRRKIALWRAGKLQANMV